MFPTSTRGTGYASTFDVTRDSQYFFLALQLGGLGSGK